MLQTQNLAARRGEAVLFSDLSFSLPPGAALVIGGPNGSGKTTLLRILAGLTHAEHGALSWCGTPMRPFDPRLRTEVLFIGHLPALKDELTALENLASLAALAGPRPAAARVREALASWGLARQHDLPARVLSQGQKRRVALARLALASAPLWLLDEPATALDDAGVATLCDAVGAHLASGGVAVIATHQTLALPDGAVQSLRLA